MYLKKKKNLNKIHFNGIPMRINKISSKFKSESSALKLKYYYLLFIRIASENFCSIALIIIRILRLKNKLIYGSIYYHILDQIFKI